ncbi:hypothetical protein, partial [Nocardia flavorosea]|uniref:hypothetical protein n=1 Tax=Nocardia flavorosea TaxID=53429 RepID=UPI002456E927
APGKPVLSAVSGDDSTAAALCRAGVDKIAYAGPEAPGREVISLCGCVVAGRGPRAGRGGGGGGARRAPPALIGGLAAFGLPAEVAVPSVLLYRVLTCWIPVFCGWQVMRWMTDKNMI